MHYNVFVSVSRARAQRVKHPTTRVENDKRVTNCKKIKQIKKLTTFTVLDWFHSNDRTFSFNCPWYITDPCTGLFY